MRVSVQEVHPEKVPIYLKNPQEAPQNHLVKMYQLRIQERVQTLHENIKSRITI